jgi:uncharacterized protein with FMN-binding domain
MAKMGNKMIALCSLALGTIYSAGYVITETEGTTVAASNFLTNTITTGQMSNTKAVYQDGTFQGQAENNIGSVQVAVTIKSDKITAVEITYCDTSYSQRNIDDLPAQVVERQSAQVDNVSGATRSTEDFQAAVEMALQQARV